MFSWYKFFCLVLFFFYGINAVKAQNPLYQKLSKANNYIYSDPEKAIKIANEVYEKSNDDQTLQLSSLITMGTAYSENFNIEKSIESLLKAQEIAQQKNDYINQVRVLSLLGYQYQILQINDKTHQYLDEAETIMTQHPLPDSLAYLRGNNYSIKALTYQQTLDCDYAIDYFNKAILVYKSLKNNEVSKINLSIGYLNKAICFLEIGKSDSVKAALIRGDKILSKLNVTNDISVAQQIAWARYYKQTGNHEKSNQILIKSLEKVKDISQIGVDKDIYQLLSQNYLALNDIEKSNHYSNLYIETQKKFSEAEKKSITHIINKPQGEQKENSSKMLNIVFLILGVIFIMILLFAFKSYRLKKKLQNLKSNQDLE